MTSHGGTFSFFVTPSNSLASVTLRVLKVASYVASRTSEIQNTVRLQYKTHFYSLILDYENPADQNGVSDQT